MNFIRILGSQPYWKDMLICHLELSRRGSGLALQRGGRYLNGDGKSKVSKCFRAMQKQWNT